MLIKHSYRTLHAEREVNDASFLITNKNGNFLHLGSNPTSRYRGYFIYDQDMFKIVEDIVPIDNQDIHGIHNKFSHIERLRRGLMEKFTLPQGSNTLIYELSDYANVELKLDVRRAYDSREFGRYYDITIFPNKIVIKYTKMTDSREDSEHGKDEIEMFIVIKGDWTEFVKNERWIHHDYTDDKKRNSPPHDRHIFSALSFNCKRLVISASTSRSEALAEAKRFGKGYKPKKQPLLESEYAKIIKKCKDRETCLAYLNSVNALQNMLIQNKKTKRIFAGLPWFFQFWTRDEAICTKALILLGEHDTAKRLLLKQVSNIGPNGRIPNRIPGTELGSADGVGWVFRRVEDLINSKTKLKKREIQRFISQLGHSLYLLLKFHTVEHFDFNESQETWMDTKYGDDDRAGARIEIQALRLNMYSLMYTLDWNKKYLEHEKALKKEMQRFKTDAIIADGLGDYTMRPNVFLAYYIYPEMFSKQEWTISFENMLKNLWLEWGGLATIDKASKLFCAEHTGENVQSYHRGDSWYFVNNLAALSLHDLNKVQFEDYIFKITQASKEEILFKGAIGNHAEVSSAIEERSEGCLAQGWSAATFIELIHELYLKE